MTARRVRVTVAGDPPMIEEVAQDDALPATGRAATLLPVPASPSQVAAGQRAWLAVVDGWQFHIVSEPADRAALRERAGTGAAHSAVTTRAVLRAVIPGRVIRVWAREGAEVEAGERLLAIEAMKMENEIRAPRSGTVERVGVEVGATVELGEELVVIS